MPITVQCDCGKRLTAPDNSLGKRARCPSCGSTVTITAPTSDADNPFAYPDNSPNVTDSETADATTPRHSIPAASAPQPSGYSGIIRIIRETAVNSGYRITSLGPGELILEKGNMWLSIIFGAIAAYINFRVRVTPAPPMSQYIAIERNTPWWTGLFGVLHVRSEFQLLTTAIADAVCVHGGEVTHRSTHGRNVGLTVSQLEGSVAGGDRMCPSCAESIKPEARVCRFCGHKFSEHEIELSTHASRDIAAKREATFDASRRQIAVEKLRRKVSACTISGWVFVAFWGLCVFASFGAYFSGAKAADGQPMTIWGVLGGMLCFTIPFGVPGFLLLSKAAKYKEEIATLHSDV